ncbi:MAG: hypothetical protein R3B97_11800 [Dehalococcoidia bacterium]
MSWPHSWQHRWNQYSARDVAADRYGYVMEDVGSVRQGNQVEGERVHAELLVREMAAMHARWWERAELAALDWPLPTLNAPQMLMGQEPMVAPHIRSSRSSDRT